MDPKQDQPIQQTPATPVNNSPIQPGLQDQVQQLNDMADESYQTMVESDEELEKMEADYAEIKARYDELMKEEETGTTPMGDAPVPTQSPVTETVSEPLQEAAPSQPVMENQPMVENLTPAAPPMPAPENPVMSEPVMTQPVQPMGQSMEQVPQPTADNTPMMAEQTPVSTMPQMQTTTEQPTEQPVQMPWQQNPTGSQQ